MRENKVQVKFSDEEIKKVKRIALRDGLPISTWLRAVAIKQVNMQTAENGTI